MGNGSRDDIVKRLETLPFPEQNLEENIPITSTQHQWFRHDVDEDIYE
ncbi:Proliferation-associated A [Gossypium arboreum]|uniref:Proliferation-associated A n=1 Tax=Gossypium arboreum TaxID=29729 RepID=A0A0B0NZI6_GOSAR|nr:Proliferation-associated A [Gossypium arboreum]